jgi:hypothetical protein
LRLVPDISLNSGGVGQNYYFNGKLRPVGGTSIAAPEMAGFFAQENAYLASIGSICGSKGNSACTPIGDPHGFLYYEGIHKNAAHNPYYDITSGCNSNDATAHYKLSYFCAGPGYDTVTGWGAANMLQLAWALNWELIANNSNGAPYVTFTGPATNKWYNTNQTVSWTIHDFDGGGTKGTGIAGETQGWDSLPADPTSEPHPGSGNSFYSGPEFPNGATGCLAFVANGCSGNNGTQGCHTVYARGWNNQGWSTAGQGFPETYGPLCYDTLPPSTAISVSRPPLGGSAKVTLTASDPGSSSGTGSGVSKTYYSINAAGCKPTATSTCAVYTAPFTIIGAGAHTVRYFSEDKAGNFEAEKSSTVTVLRILTTTDNY